MFTSSWNDFDVLRVKVQKRVIDFSRMILDDVGVGGGGVPHVLLLDVQDVKFNAFTQALMP